MSSPRHVPPARAREHAAQRSPRERSRPPAGRAGHRARRFAEQMRALRQGAEPPEREALLPPDPRAQALDAAALARRPRRHAMPPEAFGQEGAGAEVQRDPFERLRASTDESPTLIISDGSLPTAIMTPQQLQALIPAAQAQAEAAQSGSALAHAQAAALAERLVSSIRLGRVGRDGHAAELRLASGVAVRLRHEGGRLAIEVDPDPNAYDEALDLVERLRSELSRRGVEPESIELV